MTTQTAWAVAYLQRKNAEDLARQAPAVQSAAAEILKSTKDIERMLYWALDTDDIEPSHWSTRLIEEAHAILDHAHAYRAALIANPPPKEESES